MIVFNAMQLVLLGYAAWLCVERMREVQLRMRADATPLARAVARLVLAGDRATASAIVKAAMPSAFARVVAPLVAHEDAAAARAEVDEAYADMEADLERGVLALRSIASIAVAMGFCGASLKMAFALSDDAAGANGLDLSALEGAMTTMAIGVATAFPTLAAHKMLKRARTDVAENVDHAVAIVEAATRGEAPPSRARALAPDDDDDDDDTNDDVRNRRRRGMSQPA